MQDLEAEFFVLEGLGALRWGGRWQFEIDLYLRCSTRAVIPVSWTVSGDPIILNPDLRDGDRGMIGLVCRALSKIGL